MNNLNDSKLLLSKEDLSLIELTVPNTLIDYLFNDILNSYNAFDKGHGINHILTVINSSLKLAKFHNVKIPMVLTVAIYHDLGLKVNRRTHHLHSREFLINDTNLKTWFSSEDILTMGDACEDHRASNKYEPRTIYGLIISDADRTTDIVDMITRCYNYSKKHFSELNDVETYNRVYSHLKEKYGKNGYAKLYLPESESVLMEPIYKARVILDNENEFKKIYNDIVPSIV